MAFNERFKSKERIEEQMLSLESLDVYSLCTLGLGLWQQ